MRARILCLWIWISFVGWLQADYADVIAYFDSINSGSIFPVTGLDLDAVESAFGPRYQSSTGLYDFHRGIDIDSLGNGEGVLPVVAPIDGEFYDYRTTSSGGNIVILEHTLPSSITYQGETITKFFTWYLHLYDDGDSGTDGTDDLVGGYSAGDPISQGTQIGWMGQSGAPAGGGSYAVHLHWELRIGTNSSLEYQLNNPVTQWGFDPHINPMLLFEPYTYGGSGSGFYDQSLSIEGSVSTGNDISVNYEINNDDMPVLNRFDVEIIDRETEAVAKSYTLDFDQRIGYDATSTEDLDTQDTTAPYVDPQSFGDTAIAFASMLVIPGSWTSGYSLQDYEIKITATDIWGNAVSITAVPEPEALAGLLALTVLFSMGLRRRPFGSARRPV